MSDGMERGFVEEEWPKMFAMFREEGENADSPLKPHLHELGELLFVKHPDMLVKDMRKLIDNELTELFACASRINKTEFMEQMNRTFPLKGYDTDARGYPLDAPPEVQADDRF